MATQINGTTGRNSSYWRYYLVCTEQDISIPNNTSKLKVDVYLGATSYSRAVRGAISATHTVNVNGTNYTFTTGAYTIEKNTNVLLGSITTNAITHNADGSKSVSVTASSPDLAQASGYGPYSGSASGTVTLTTIPRTSSVTCADGNIGSATTINIVRASNTFTHTLTYSFGTLTGTIATKTSQTSIGWTIPTSFYTMIPNSSVGQGTVFCETYSGDTLIGTTSCLFNAIVLEVNNKPTITATVTDINSTTTALTGDANKLVKYFSNAQVVITTSAKNSATIKMQKVTCGGQSRTTATSTIEKVESGTFNLTCADSRGFVGTNTVTKTMVNYIKLAITSLTIARESSTSNTVKISLKGNYFNGSFGSVANTLTLKWRYRLQGGTWSGYTTITATKSGNTFSYSGTLGTTFDYQQAYEFEVVAQDKLIIDTKTQPVTAGTPLVDMWKDNVKVNGTVTSNKFEGLATKASQDEDGKKLASFYLRNFNRSMAAAGTNLDNPGINGLFEVRSNSEVTYTGAKPFEGYYPFLNIKTPDNIAMLQIAGLKGKLYYRGQQSANVTMSGLSWSKIRDSSNWGVNLYNNTSGTTGTVTLSETSANFTYLDIFWKDSFSSRNGCVRIYSPNSKQFHINYMEFANSANAAYAFGRTFTISGTSVTPTNNYGYIQIGTTTSTYENRFQIIRVDGYR